MIAPLVDLPVRRLFRSLSLSVPWRGGSDGSGTDTATIAIGAGAKSDSTHDDNFAAAAPLSFELQTWPIPPTSASSISVASSTTTTTTTTTTTARTASPRTITTLVEDPESSSAQDQAQLTRLRMHSATRQHREKYPHQLTQIRPRASRGSFDSSRSRSSTISTTSSSSGDDLTAFKRPQERQRACEDCWKEFWG